MFRIVAFVLCALVAAPAAAKVGPPDPRKGERLDGRSAPRDPSRVALAVPRLVLLGPRLVLRGILTPLIRGSAYVEERAYYKRAYYATTSDDGKIGVRPDIRYDSAFGVALGAGFFDKRSLGPDSLVLVRFRIGSPDKMMGELRLRGPHRLIGFHARYDKHPYAVFAGIHGETRAELEAMGLERARYAFDRGVVGLDSDLHLGRMVTVRSIAEADMAVYQPGEGRGTDPPIDQVYDTMTIPGFDTGTQIARGGAEITLDTRHEKRFGTGLMLSTGAYGARGIEDDPSRFATFTGEARGYLGLHDRALILRVRGGMIETIGDAPVPFEQLLSPTGPDGMRGLPAGERRGMSELVGSLEYQWLIAPAFDASVFVDHGGAFDERFDGLAWSRLEPSFGVGVRHLSPARPYWLAVPNGGVQLAFSPDHGVRFVFSVGL